jgi:hypothetical protein
VPGDAEDLYLCYWNFNRQNGLLVSNGTYDIGFTVTGQKDNGVSVTPDVNPDSVRAGQVIYAQPQISDNYAGYAAANAADPTPYQQVTATWQIPSATCSPDAAASSPENTSDAAIWVGLTPEDAANPGSKTPIYQLGTDSICFQGVPQYDAWWEIYPAPSYNISPTNALFNVQSGDIATATVTYQQNTGTFILSIQVRTSTASNALSIVNWSSTPQLGASIGATMAECIVESPADATTNKLIPLAEFGKVSVDCQVNNNKPIASGPQNYLFQMQTDGGAPKATVSPLASDGSTFTVTWNHG